MPGHIYYRIGDYAHAKESFAASMKADEQIMQAQHVAVDEIGITCTTSCT